eukprot:4364113-Pleurochrysis_carterae.AAC.11
MIARLPCKAQWVLTASIAETGCVFETVRSYIFFAANAVDGVYMATKWTEPRTLAYMEYKQSVDFDLSHIITFVDDGMDDVKEQMCIELQANKARSY